MTRCAAFWGSILVMACFAVVPPVSEAAPAKSAKPGTGASANTGAAPAKAVPPGVDPASFTAVKLPPASEGELTGLREAAAVYEKRDYDRAVSILTPLADKGSARAAFSLGLMAMRGHGMPMSTETCEKWWVRSARGGFPEAQYQLGFMYHQGLRGPRNPELVARLWSLAAAQGQGDAMYGLGFMYRAGDGVARDGKKSLKMFTDAVGLGHPGAAYEAGLLYRYGREGAPKDPARAKQYLKKAADAGNPDARRELADME